MRCWTRWGVVALVCLLGCDRAQTKDEIVVDPRATVRAALLDGSSCYGKTSLLCIEDESFIESSIDAALESSRWKGEMPKTRPDVERVTRSARAKYRDSMKSPVGLAALEKVVLQRYADPVIDESVPGIVSIDLGALPGELRSSRRGAAVVLRSSEMMDGFEWKASEAGRQLAKYADAYPNADEIRIEVRYPSSSERHFVYRYSRASNRVVHHELKATRGGGQYVSKPIEGGLGTLRSGALKLDSADGRTCYPSRGDGANCRVPDRYLEAMKP